MGAGDIANTILRFAAEYRVGHIVVGRTGPKPLWRRRGRNRAVVDHLIKNARGITIIVLDTREELPGSGSLRAEIPEEDLASRPAGGSEAPPAERQVLSRCLSPRHVVIWETPVEKETVLRVLASTLGREPGIENPENLFESITKREKQGSTFLNEGVAFPHVRITGLAAPVIALGLTKGGLADVATEKPIAIVFLILSPDQAPETQVKLLGLASRAAQNRHLVQALRSVRMPEEAVRAIRDWEAPET